MKTRTSNLFCFKILSKICKAWRLLRLYCCTKIYFIIFKKLWISRQLEVLVNFHFSTFSSRKSHITPKSDRVISLAIYCFTDILCLWLIWQTSSVQIYTNRATVERHLIMTGVESLMGYVWEEIFQFPSSYPLRVGKFSMASQFLFQYPFHINHPSSIFTYHHHPWMAGWMYGSVVWNMWHALPFTISRRGKTDLCTWPLVLTSPTPISSLSETAIMLALSLPTVYQHSLTIQHKVRLSVLCLKGETDIIDLEKQWIVSDIGYSWTGCLYITVLTNLIVS